MTLYETLQKASSEEDVKAAYIRALGLKDVQRNLIDIQDVMKAYGESAEGRPTDFTTFESAYRTLADKLRPQVYEYGFLK